LRSKNTLVAIYKCSTILEAAEIAAVEAEVYC